MKWHKHAFRVRVQPEERSALLSGRGRARITAENAIPFDKNQKWLGLRIVDTTVTGDASAVLEFIARSRVSNTSAVRHHERSNSSSSSLKTSRRSHTARGLRQRNSARRALRRFAEVSVAAWHGNPATCVQRLPQCPCPQDATNGWREGHRRTCQKPIFTSTPPTAQQPFPKASSSFEIRALTIHASRGT